MSNLTTLSTGNRRIEQLADTMFALHAEGHDVTETLLIQEGYSTFELGAYAAAARQIANQRFVRRVEAEGFTKTDDELLAIAVPEATGLVDEQAIFAHLRRLGFTNASLARIWTKLMGRLATSIAGRPLPRVA